MTWLRFLCSISVGFCLLVSLSFSVLVPGCGTDTLGGSDDVSLCLEGLPAGPTCEAFCERVVVDCDALNAVTKESCVQGCECDLQETREISNECGEAQEKGFLCTSELDCQGVFDFFSFTPTDDPPCRGAVQDVIAACEG